jgi:hypothetical protein
MAVIACSFDGGPWDGREVALPDPEGSILVLKDAAGKIEEYATNPEHVPADTDKTVGTYQRYGVSRTYLWRGWGDGSC